MEAHLLPVLCYCCLILWSRDHEGLRQAIMAATIREESMQIMEEMLEIGEGLELEDEKAELDELVQLIFYDINYFNEDKGFDRPS